MGVDFGMPISFDVKGLWLLNQYSYSESSISSTYTNTSTAGDDSLDEVGDYEITSYSMPYYYSTGGFVVSDADNFESVLAFEPEIGLNVGNLSSKISLGAAFYNLGANEGSYLNTTSSYADGSDVSLLDTEELYSSTGAVYYDSDSGVESSVSMDASISDTYLERTVLGFDSDSNINLGNNIALKFMLGADYGIYPAAICEFSTIEIQYDDYTGTPVETSRNSSTTCISQSINAAISGHAKAAFSKSFIPDERAAFYLGAGFGYDIDYKTAEKEQTRTLRVQIDNDGDNAYTTAGTDIDTSTIYTGYTTQVDEMIHTIEVSVPLSVSYTPISDMTFYAGAKTTISLVIDSISSLVTGQSGYVYTEYVDNLESDNSIDAELIDGTENYYTPGNSIETTLDVEAEGNFGFTLALTEKFKIDAYATVSADSGIMGMPTSADSGVGFDSFSLTGSYSF